MHPQEQLSMMERILKELIDLSNNQTAVLKKISEIEFDILSIRNNDLEEKLAALFEHTSQNQNLVSGFTSLFNEKTEQFRIKHKP